MKPLHYFFKIWTKWWHLIVTRRNKVTNTNAFIQKSIVEDVLVNKVVFFWNFSHCWHLQINNKSFSPSLLDALNELPERISDGNIKLFDDSLFQNLKFALELASIVRFCRYKLASKNHFFPKMEHQMLLYRISFIIN